ncbi:MAG: acylneuraminate cytidylyltransferase family protein [Nitrospirota bacterium]
MNTIAIIPIRGNDPQAQPGFTLGGRPLLAYTVEAARASRLIERVVVTTDSPEIAGLARDCGADAPFLRPAELSRPEVPLGSVLKHCVDWLEREEACRTDIVTLLEITHPIREEGLIDQVIQVLLDQHLDSVFVAVEERQSFWRMDRYGALIRVGDEEDQPRQTREPLYREMGGIVTATRAEWIKEGKRLGKRVGLIPLRSLSAKVDTHDEVGLFLARHLALTITVG